MKSTLAGRRSGALCLSRPSLAALDPEVDLHPLFILLQDAVVLAEREALPVFGKQDALHVRMAVELDAEHVVDFALQPVRGRPDGNGRRQGSAVGDLRFYADALVALERIKNPDDFELLFSCGIVRRGDVEAIVELLFVAEKAQEGRD